MKKYALDSQKSLDFFKENLENVNKLSESILHFVKFDLGNFYTFLSDGIQDADLYQFHAGKNTGHIRSKIAKTIESLINSDRTLCCFFDDFNSNLDQEKETPFHQENGMHYKHEVYYVVKPPAKSGLILECLQSSDTLWHSLCVITKIDYKKIKTDELDEQLIEMICKNATFIIIGAYDAEGYVFWEKAAKHQ